MELFIKNLKSSHRNLNFLLIFLDLVTVQSAALEFKSYELVTNPVPKPLHLIRIQVNDADLDGSDSQPWIRRNTGFGNRK